MDEIFIVFWWIYFCIFFSNYVLVYAISHLLAKKKNWKTFVHTKVYPLLPLAYALIATYFWVTSFYYYRPDYILNTIMSSTAAKVLIAWSFLGLLFWLPFLRKNNTFCLVHSIPLFLLPLAGIVSNIFKYGIVERNDALNVLRIYTAGLLVYAIALAILSLTRFLILRFVFPKHRVT